MVQSTHVNGAHGALELQMQQYVTPPQALHLDGAQSTDGDTDLDGAHSTEDDTVSEKQALGGKARKQHFTIGTICSTAVFPPVNSPNLPPPIQSPAPRHHVAARPRQPPDSIPRSAMYSPNRGIVGLWDCGENPQPLG
jgi:hypothetical protein